MMIKKVRLYTGLLIATLLTGCNTSPPEVYAQRPLVENVVVSAAELNLDDSIWPQLANGLPGEQLNYQGVELILADRYTSALGYLCRNVYLSLAQSALMDSTQQKRVACQNPNTAAWVLVPQVIDNKNATIIFGQ